LFNTQARRTGVKVELCNGNGQATPGVAAAWAILVHMGADETAEEAVTATEPKVEDGREVDTAIEDATEVDDRPPGAHRRGRGLWLPIVIFVVLLAAAAVVGRIVVPAGGPEAGAPPPTAIGSASPQPQPTATPVLPGLPPLPTPPPRPADALEGWAQRIGSMINVPQVAIEAYGYAQLMLQQTDPGCRLSWTTLAGIAQVESTHGQAGGAVLEPGGRSSPPITGPLLDGRSGRPLVRDTDAGAFDGDATYDRTMGPMRLVPTVWRAQAIDADADGILDPYDIDDASLALARLLCSGPEDLSRLSGWTAAVERFRDTPADYARSVFREADNYGQLTRNAG
jgi:hypothetical protein